jgi:hypothetical protein
MSIDEYIDYFDDNYEIGLYGVVEYYDEDAEEYTKRRILKTRRDKDKYGNPIRQHYWVKGVFKGGFVRRSSRFNFIGSGHDINHAIRGALSDHIVPVGFVDVDADDFLRNPLKYGVNGIWITFKVDYHV